MAKAIAMRWSPPVTMVAAVGRGVVGCSGVTRQPSWQLLGVDADGLQSVDHERDAVRFLGPQLARVAQLATVRPPPAMTMARSGSSSMRSATRAPSMRMPRSGRAAADHEVAHRLGSGRVALRDRRCRRPSRAARR